MPRRSRAALSVVAPHPTRSSPLLEPPGELGPRESKLFKDIVGSTDPKHFIKTDALVLARYCEALVLAGDAAKEIRDGGMIVDGRANPAGGRPAAERL